MLLFVLPINSLVLNGVADVADVAAFPTTPWGRLDVCLTKN